jgi:dTDP-4-amino-4,6-dideoxygalactose transaminase
MTRKKGRLRHLPPTAVPVGVSDLQAGLRSSNTTLDQFQTAIASYLGVSNAACKLASSGRTALYCLLLGLKLENPSRRQVIMPAYTCPAVARVAIDLDLQPIFVDISMETMGYMPDPLATAVGQETLAVILVHPFGISLPVDKIIAVAHAVGAAVIEDAAQALGAKWDGKPVGTRGDFGLFSLGPGKPISTGGGGIAIANNVQDIPSFVEWWAELPEASNMASAAAWMRQAAFQLAFHPNGWWLATRVGLHRVGNHETSWGYSVQSLTPTQARMGLALLPRLDEINAQRRRKAFVLEEVISQSRSVQTVSISEAAEPFYLRFPLFAENEEQREMLYDQFWSAGIGAGRLYEKSLPSLLSPDEPASFPGAEAVASRLLTLPTHHYVTDNDIQIMSEILLKFT